MADERPKDPYRQKSPVPEKYSWPSLIKKDGDELFDHYRGRSCGCGGGRMGRYVSANGRRALRYEIASTATPSRNDGKTVPGDVIQSVSACVTSVVRQRYAPCTSM